MKARIKKTGELWKVVSICLEKGQVSGQWFELDEIELIPDEPETISDGHGNAWSKKCECGSDMQVVRPGSAICETCNDEILANDGME